jgi:hypothetical protein
VTSHGGRLQTGPTGREGRARSPLRRRPTRTQLRAVYRALLAAYGEQQWWPTAAADGEDARLEICLGAILTQNTAWRGAAAALDNLRNEQALSCEAILDLPHDVLAELVRPSGHFNVKARKLQAFAELVVEECGGSIDVLLDGERRSSSMRIRTGSSSGSISPRASASTMCTVTSCSRRSRRTSGR